MATYVYDDFRVTLAPLADGSYEARAVDETGAEHVGVFRVPLDEKDLEQAVLDVARGSSRAAATETRDVGAAGPPSFDAETIGGGLADALLAGDLEVAYGEARQRAAAAGRGLRLTLSLGAAPQLLSVPWEFLYRRPRFFANQRQTPLVRHLETQAPPAPPCIDRIVRVLGVVASPSDLGPLDVAAERERMEQAIAKVASLGRVELDWLEPATPRSLRQALRDGSYHILHYVGHSDFTATGDGMLFLEDADGTSAEVDSTELANLLADQTSLRLVVLNSCEGARTTLTDPYAGVATTLVQLGVPAVVAMQFEISDAAAILFAEELYVNLIGRQDPIDAAVAEARKAIYIEQGGGTEWATPVLFMGDVDVELFDFAIDAADLPPPPPPDPKPWDIVVHPKTPRRQGARERARRRWTTFGVGVRVLLVLAGVLAAAVLIALIVAVVAGIRDNLGAPAVMVAAVSLLPARAGGGP